MERSALGVVLHISRVVGVAPFLQGDEYRVSLPMIMCAKLFISITAILYILSAATSPVFYVNSGAVLVYGITILLSKLSAVVTAFVSVFTSPERTMRFLRFHKELNKIDTQVLNVRHPKANEIKLTVLILIHLNVTLAISIYEYLLYVPSYDTGNMDMLLLQVLLVIVNSIVSLSEFQVFLFARRSLSSVKIINDDLENLNNSQSMNDITLLDKNPKLTTVAWEKVSKTQIINTQTKRSSFENVNPCLNNKLLAPAVKNVEGINKEPINLIRQCIKNYLSVCNIIRTSSKGDGLLIVVLILYHIIYILSNSYKIVLYLLTMHLNSVEINIFLAIYGSITHFGILICLMEPYHKTQSEMQRLQFILTSLKWKKFDKTDISNELNLFWRVININKATCSPLGMFTPNRLLIVKIFGSVVTYLVILVTYGPEIK